jgi:cold shock CspA family protein
MNDLKTGVVKYWNATKWYGFILRDDTNESIFMHQHETFYSNIEKGDRVTFKVQASRNNPGKECAVDVNLIEEQ